MKLHHYEHQWPLVGDNDFVVADWASVAANKVIGLPEGAQVISAWVNVIVAYDATTTATLSVGDAALATRYGSGVDLKTVGRKNLTPTGYIMPAAGAVIATFAQTGTASVNGEARVYIEYIRARKADEVQY